MNKDQADRIELTYKSLKILKRDIADQIELAKKQINYLEDLQKTLSDQNDKLEEPAPSDKAVAETGSD